MALNWARTFLATATLGMGQTCYLQLNDSTASNVVGGACNAVLRNDAGSVLVQSLGGLGITVASGTGYLGVGKAPANALDVSGSINFTGSLTSNGVPFVSGSGGAASQWTTSNTNVFIASNVGVNKFPAVALDVSGSINFTGSLTSNGVAVSGGGMTAPYAFDTVNTPSTTYAVGADSYWCQAFTASASNVVHTSWTQQSFTANNSSRAYFNGPYVVTSSSTNQQGLGSLPTTASTTAQKGVLPLYSAMAFGGVSTFPTLNSGVMDIKSPTQMWISTNNLYDATTGSYTGSASTSGTAGEWIQVQLPTKLAITSLQIAIANSTNGDNGNSGFNVFGSLDGTTWSSVWASTATTNGTVYTHSISNVVCAYLRFVVTATGETGTGNWTGYLPSGYSGAANFALLNGLSWTGNPVSDYDVGTAVCRLNCGLMLGAIGSYIDQGVQFGSQTVSSSSFTTTTAVSVTVTFPNAFVVKPRTVFAMARDSAGSGGIVCCLQTGNNNPSTTTAIFDLFGTGAFTATPTIFWLAIE